MQMTVDNSNHRVFRRFTHVEEATTFAIQLAALGFSPSQVMDAPVVDPLFVGNGTIWHLVKLPGEDFDRAETALLEMARGEEEDVPADHYLQSFTDRELMEVLVRPDEWSADDAVWAQQLLRQRGKPVSSEAIELLRKARVDDLRAEEPAQTPWLFLGYVLALLGGLLGIIIGWYINTSKKTLPNGERVSVYGPQDRKHGARIFILGLVMLVLWLAVRIWLLIYA